MIDVNGPGTFGAVSCLADATPKGGVLASDYELKFPVFLIQPESPPDGINVNMSVRFYQTREDCAKRTPVDEKVYPLFTVFSR